MKFQDTAAVATFGFDRLKEVVAEFPDDMIDDCSVSNNEQDLVVIVARGPNAKHLIEAYKGRPR